MKKDFEKITKETYNTISSNWETKRQFIWKPISDFLQKQKNKQNLKLLDLGCGTGRCLNFAKQIGFENQNLIGSDYSKGQLEIVKKKSFQISNDNMLNLNFKDETFDIILCIAAHHHLLKEKEQLKALQEMRRVLKKTGKILICNWFPTKEYIQKQLEKRKFEFLDLNKKQVKVTYTFENKKYDRYYYLFNEKEWTNQIKKIGFKILKKEHFQGNLYLEFEKV